MEYPAPMSGVRVLDLSRVLAGPGCTMLLADLGADVLKVERPAVGDDTRGWGPPFAEDGQSAYFRAANRNKLSVACDLAAPADRTLLEHLLDGADVVVENFRPGVLPRYGSERGSILARNQRLVWCTIGGFEDAPTRPAYDLLVQAEAGWMAITGPEAGPPSKVGVALADLVAGRDAAVAILAELLAVRTSAAPRPVAARHRSVFLSRSARAVLANVAQGVLVTGGDAVRRGNAHPQIVPYELFEAADRPFVLAVGSDAQWAACGAAIGAPDWMREPALATNAARVLARERLVAALGEHFRTRPAGDWLARLAPRGSSGRSPSRSPACRPTRASASRRPSATTRIRRAASRRPRSMRTGRSCVPPAGRRSTAPESPAAPAERPGRRHAVREARTAPGHAPPPRDQRPSGSSMGRDDRCHDLPPRLRARAVPPVRPFCPWTDGLSLRPQCAPIRRSSRSSSRATARRSRRSSADTATRSIGTPSA